MTSVFAVTFAPVSILYKYTITLYYLASFVAIRIRELVNCVQCNTDIE